MFLKKWEELPEFMQTDVVLGYYESLSKKKISLFIKRVFDIVASCILIVITSPLMLIIAVMVKCDSKGPVFFRQKRVTQYGKCFRIFKFRTMVDNAESKGALVTVGSDMRITNVGKLLRKVRLDELPQLFNVLSGDMTFVGTRPEVLKYVESYTDEMNATLLLPAGITSMASIMYKDEDEILAKADEKCSVDEMYIAQVLPAKMEYNLKSIKEFSVWSELLTMLQTVVAVLR